MSDHLIGLLLGAEEDWPRAFEAILRRVGPADRRRPAAHGLQRAAHASSRSTSTDPVRTDLVIDRLAYWYYHPREWLKKAALVNGTYLLNSPFTFQSMEKHSAYCAMLRLGLKVPRHDPGALQEPGRQRPLGLHLGEVQPLLRPRRDRRRARLPALHEAVRRRRLARCLPDQRPRRPAPRLRRVRRDADAPPGDGRLRALRPGAVDRPRDDGHGLPAGPADAPALRRHPRLPLRVGRPARRQRSAGSSTRSSTGSSTPRRCWSQGDDVYPIDYANACPDVAVTSLHYYFPWAITALVRWSVYCVVTGRRSNVDLETSRYFEIADSDRTYDEKLAAYLELADAHFETDRYREWCAEHLPHLDEQVHDWVTSDDFDRLLRDTVAATYPPHEQDSSSPTSAACSGSGPRRTPPPDRVSTGSTAVGSGSRTARATTTVSCAAIGPPWVRGRRDRRSARSAPTASAAPARRERACWCRRAGVRRAPRRLRPARSRCCRAGRPSPPSAAGGRPPTPAATPPGWPRRRSRRPRPRSGRTGRWRPGGCRRSRDGPPAP